MASLSLRSLLLFMIAGGCSAAENVVGPPAGEDDRRLVASKVAILGLAVAMGHDGSGPFDNSMACARRGIITYYNTPTGRIATFIGCDAGDEVVIDGAVPVNWTDPRNESARISAIDIAGRLNVRVRGVESSIDGVTMTGIAYTNPTSQPAALMSFDGSGASITAFGVTHAFHLLATPSHVITPAMTIDYIANPGGSPDALTEVDLKRLALEPMILFASMVLDESGRSAHSHTMACGTTQVTPEVGGKVRLDMNWSSCAMGPGMFVSGTFTLRGTLSEAAMEIELTGAPSFGGGVPRVTLDRFTWKATGFGDAEPYEMILTGLVAAGTKQRTYSFKVLVDD